MPSRSGQAAPVPAAKPRPIVQRLSADVNAILGQSDTVETLASLA